MPIKDQKKVAILIDAENTSSRYIKLIFDEIGAYGFPTYKRVYGGNESIQGWKDIVLKYAMTPVMLFNYTHGKNSSDSALVIDAMDILYTGNVDGFCLVTSDSDFTKLAIRLRESGAFVIGMGEQKTPESLVRACEEFKYLDILYRDNNEEYTPQPVRQHHDNAIPNALPDTETVKKDISRIIDSVFPGVEWVLLGDLGNVLPQQIPGFDQRNYGFAKLSKFIESLGCFELKYLPEGDPLSSLHIRNKQE